MSGNGYKALGFVVWKLGLWYMRRRYGALGKRAGAGLMVAVGLAGAVLAKRRHADDG